ncbi:flavodoxin family protein [Desulfoluna butyratoxydans]|uniref:Flavoprotein-like domain n=1 Tax=Desulfoluna butyratoxydans TaxID=231438 RepID=A0A4U8YNK0_9BACT|nr:flavodoxin family protein [Desulfoluna butyratoxydans]VFQ42793.1 flavoprotein-like domain [Desulfoluna butyratoxydans]
MNILIVCYSRTGCTEKLAERIAHELSSRGHAVARDFLEVESEKSCWSLLFRQIHQYPLVGLSLISASFYHWWLNIYHQPEDDIHPPMFPDVSGFDHVCIGGPKWAYTSYPIARYLKKIKGLQHKPVSAFATFGGPPLKRFELDFIFTPMNRQIQNAGGSLVSTLGLSSNYHELHLIGIFRLFSQLVLRRPLRSFTVDSDYGRQELTSFCNKIEQETSRHSSKACI